jgi:hypothetical protein
MFHRWSALPVVALVCAIGAASPVLAQSKRMGPVALFDKDNDATVDFYEAKMAAIALFDKLEINKQGTLDRMQLRGRLGPRAFAAADVNHDNVLNMGEFLALVVQRFKTADPDNDGTLSAAEFKTRAGRALLRLLK